MSMKADGAMHAEPKRATSRPIKVALVIGGIIAGASLLISCRGGVTMSPTEAATQVQPGLPPIDLSAPAKTKTATFAMG